MDSTTQPNYTRNEGLKTWLNVMNASLSAVEQTLWQARGLAERTVDAFKKVEQGAGVVKDEYAELSKDIVEWKQQAKRMKKTGWMLTKITTGYRLWGIKSAFISKGRMEKEFNRLHRKNARLFTKVSLEQGGAFLKVGQLLSARADILPKAWVEELRILQDQTKPECFDEIKRMLEQELGAPLEQVFLEFDSKPIAAASIGQVHKATLKNGEVVAVKIQRPGLETIIKQDMALLKLFINSIESLLPPTDLDTIVAEIERTVHEELDYTTECRWMQTVADALTEVEGVIVPKPVNSLCTSKVMVSEFVVGTPLARKLDNLDSQGEKEALSDLLGRLLDLYLRQVLQHGVFQADPHPGNFLVTEANELVLLDFGCTMQLSESFKEGYGKVLGAALLDESDAMAQELVRMGFQTRSGKPDTLVLFANALLGQIKQAANNMSRGEMHWPSQMEMMQGAQGLFEQAERDPVDKLPAEFIMLARVFTTLGGLFTHYKPNMDVHKYLVPHLVAPALSQVF
ncbi:MAG: AarF/UbiB family protein [Pseudomonadales bacterium]|nr:AarF/UbiB family protein [Pseudomonadales bacterium]